MYPRTYTCSRVHNLYSAKVCQLPSGSPSMPFNLAKRTVYSGLQYIRRIPVLYTMSSMTCCAYLLSSCALRGQCTSGANSSVVASTACLPAIAVHPILCVRVIAQAMRMPRVSKTPSLAKRTAFIPTARGMGEEQIEVRAVSSPRQRFWRGSVHCGPSPIRCRAGVYLLGPPARPPDNRPGPCPA